MAKNEKLFALAIDRSNNFERHNDLNKKSIRWLIDEFTKGNIDSLYLSKEE